MTVIPRPSLDRLPPEILHYVLYHLDIPDILRVRRVSRYLNQVSLSRDVWSDAYRKADFVRPPGPFFSQSTDDLERALVSSFRVDQNLRSTTQTERPARKLKEIQYTGVELRVSLVFGRFLLIAFSQEVRCYVLNSGDSGAKIIYRSQRGGTLKSFHCASAFDVEGRPFACVVLNEEMNMTRQISTYSFDVGEQSEVTLELLHQFEYHALDVVCVNLGPRVIVIHGRVLRDSITDVHTVALDVHSRVQFLLPSCTCATWKTADPDELTEFMDVQKFMLPASISTSTHLFLAHSFYAFATRGWKTFIRAFALPHPDAYPNLVSTLTPLSVSHCGIISGMYITSNALLHDSILDPSTQGVRVAIQVHAFEHSCPLVSDVKHGILHLSTEHTAHDQDSEVGAITFQLRGFLASPETRFHHTSFNGIGRAFNTLFRGDYCAVIAFEYDVRASGDGDDKHAAKVVEYPCILRFPTARALMDYDPYFGRICLRAVTAEYNVIEVSDLAV